MKIAFVTTYNAKDINSWSGTPYYMSNAFIDAGVKVDFIGNLKTSPVYFSFKLKNKIFNDILRKKFGEYQRFYEPKSLKYFSRQVEEQLEDSDTDLVLSPGALPIAYLKTKKPIVMWSDATFAAMLNYYPGFSNFNWLSIKNCHRYEKSVLNRAALSCFSSDWAAVSAIKHYNADAKKIKVIPYGANLQGNKGIEDIEKINERKSRTCCELLFIGQEWERKGADLTLKIAEELNNSGLKTTLHLVGLNNIPMEKLPEFVINHGFINKAASNGLEKMNLLFSRSHFLILPTKADCSPMVFAEANSFGLPVITSNTGGIPSLIRNNINGKMFNVGVNAKEYAGYIRNLYLDFDEYKWISKSSFNEYKTTLNWKESVNKMLAHMNNILLTKKLNPK